MISKKELLGIICTEAIEYGGLQEIPAYKDGSRQSFHSPKRHARGSERAKGVREGPEAKTVKYNLRLVRTAEGKLEWKD